MYKVITLHIDGILTEQVDTPDVGSTHLQLITERLPRWAAEDSKPRTFFPARFRFVGWGRVWYSRVSRPGDR